MLAKLAISIARKMNALIFLVPEDIVDIRPRLVCIFNGMNFLLLTIFILDFNLRRQLDEHCSVNVLTRMSITMIFFLIEYL